MSKKLLAMKTGEEIDAAIGNLFNFAYKNEFRAAVNDGVVKWFTTLSEATDWHKEFTLKNPNHPYSKNGGSIVTAMVYRPYSTDLVAAWEVEAKMRELKWWIHIEVTGNLWYAVNYWNCETSEHSEVVHCNTIMESICKAALLALAINGK
jgi:hypothetical protein